MKVTHIGHAGFAVECEQGGRLVCDPWFNSAFLKSWFPWPDNRQHVELALTADALYISHAHEDHFDREFLKAFPRKHIPVIVPKFRSRYLGKELRALGFTNVKEMEHGDTYWLFDGMDVKMLIDRSHKEDSALLCEDLDTGYRFLDANDCELASSDWPTTIDLLASQFSGAFWYPHCYMYTEEEQKVKAAEVRKNNLDRLVRRIKLTDAREYLPSAGPPAFLDTELRSYNFRGIFPQYIDIDEDLMAQCPGLQLHPAMHGGIINYPALQADRRKEWESWYHEDNTAVTGEELIAHFEALQSANSKFLEDYRNDIAIYSGNQDWQIQLGLIEGELEESFDPHYFMNVPPRVLRAVVDGRATWETALLSMRIKLSRNPDKYDYKLMGLLNFGDRPAQTLAMHKAKKSTETIERDGLVLPKYCPHAGENMAIAKICDGVIECPRHGWKWDADTGACIEGEIPLAIKKL